MLCLSSFWACLHKNKSLHEPFLMVFLVLGTFLSLPNSLRQETSVIIHYLISYLVSPLPLSVLSTWCPVLSKLHVSVGNFPAIKARDYFFGGKAVILVSPIALVLPKASSFAAVVHQWCKSCLQIQHGFPVSGPKLQHGTKIFRYSGAREDQKIALDSRTSDLILRFQKYGYTVVLKCPFSGKPIPTWPTENNIPCNAGIRFTSLTISVSCPDGNTRIQACSWILWYIKSWNDKLSFQKQAQCNSRATMEHFVYMLFPCLIAHCGLWCFFFPSLIMCSEKMDYSEHLNR